MYIDLLYILVYEVMGFCEFHMLMQQVFQQELCVFEFL